MTNKRQLTYRKSAIREQDDTPEWRRVSWARLHEMEPILDALQNQNIPIDIKNCLKNCLIISLVSTIEVYFRSVATKSIDKWNTDISKVVQEEVRIPLSAFEYISKGNITRGSLVASNFSFAQPSDINEFFSKALSIKCFEILKEFDRLDPSNYFPYAASLNRNWKSFMQMFELRNSLVHDKQPITLSPKQLKSLCNCTMNLLDAAQIVCNKEFNKNFKRRLAWLRQRQKAKHARRKNKRKPARSSGLS